MEENRSYICIDLKSFYASVECHERNLDPLTTNLVVADVSRTEKTICLAVSPSLKAYGLPGRARLFEVEQKLKNINYERKKQNRVYKFEGKSTSSIELRNNPKLEIGYIAATPRMALYIEYSTRIYSIYLRYVAPEHIHVYSIDEVFIDVTKYLKTYGLTARELARKMIQDVLDETGITATAGVAPNMYLAKVAMDIVAKHISADKDGVRIAELDEMEYRKKLWEHQPLTDFWRVGKGYVTRLEKIGLYTMGDIAKCSVGKANEYYNEDLLYKTFGINAELLIDHAWGYEPTTIEDIKRYKPDNNSMGIGQVLHCSYSYEKATIIVKEMVDQLVLSLIEKKLVTDQIILVISYDNKTLVGDEPTFCHGVAYLGRFTTSSTIAREKVLSLFERIMDKRKLVKRVNITAGRVISENDIPKNKEVEQLNLFKDYEQERVEEEKIEKEIAREKKSQEAILAIKKKYGKNAVLRGMDLEDGGTTKERNEQIGGHKA